MLDLYECLRCTTIEKHFVGHTSAESYVLYGLYSSTVRTRTKLDTVHLPFLSKPTIAYNVMITKPSRTEMNFDESSYTRRGTVAVSAIIMTVS
jgi:hypothetical protein